MKNSNKTKPKRNLNLYSLLGVFLIFLLLFSCIVVGSKKNSSGNGGSNTGEDGEDVANGGDGKGGDGKGGDGSGSDGSGSDGSGGDGKDDGSGGDGKDDGKDDGTKTTTKYTLTVSSPTCGTVTNGDSTINCGSGGSDCSAQFDKDKSVTLTAAAASSGYTIGDWGGDCSGSSDCTLSIEANKTVTKAFTLSAGASDSDNDCTPDATDTDDDDDTVPDTIDVDDDDDGLIEIENLDMFNNIRHNLAGTSYKTSSTALDNRMGAPTDATDDCDTASGGVYLCGYELTKDLDFAEGASYASSSVNTNWRPNQSDPDMATNAGFTGASSFAGIFEGNGYEISNLYSRNTTSGTVDIGLFARIRGAATIRNLGVADANLYGGADDDTVGALVGQNNGSITASFATGGTLNSDDGADSVGALVGQNNGNITASFATGGTLNSDDGVDHVGGLVGNNEGGNIIASYATGAANGGDGEDNVGGLVGWNNNGGRIIASYATGDANGGDGNDDEVGGLVGYNDNGSIIIASFAKGDADGGNGEGDDTGGLVGWGQSGSDIIACYATGDANSGNETRDNAGSLIGIGSTVVTASYGFGNATGTTIKTDGTGSDIPMGVSSAADLTAMNAGTEWDDDSEDTSDAWNFGTGSQSPALKYANYDDAGGTDFSCNMFPAKIPGTNTALTCGTTLLPGQGR